MEPRSSWFVGIDWGETKHQVCVLDAAGRERGSRAFSHTGSGLRALVKWLKKQTRVAPSLMAVGIERPDGPVVATLLAAGFGVHAINPRQISHFRKFASHAGNKDDKRDARWLAEAVMTHRPVLRRVELPPALIARLRERTKTADKLIRERTRQCQRIRNVLVDYFPPLLEVAGKAKNLGKPLFLEIWAKASTPEAAHKVRRSTWAKLLRRYGVTRITPDRVVALFREEALVLAPGAREAALESIRTALALLQVLNAEIERAEREMTRLLDALAQTPEVGGGPDATAPDLVSIFRSRKGAGDKALARLFAWAFEAIREGNYRRLRAACGVAPILDESGKFSHSRLRRAVPNSLQQATYILARGVLRWDDDVKAYNQKLKAAGKKTARRQRSIADKQFRVLCAMARHRTLFDPHFATKSRSAAA